MNFDLRIKDLTKVWDCFSEHDENFCFADYCRESFFITNCFFYFSDVNKLRYVDRIVKVDWTQKYPFIDNKGRAWAYATPFSNIDYDRFVVFTRERMKKIPWNMEGLTLRIKHNDAEFDDQGKAFTLESFNDNAVSIKTEDGNTHNIPFYDLFLCYKLCFGGIWMPFGFDTEEDFEEIEQ